MTSRKGGSAASGPVRCLDLSHESQWTNKTTEQIANDGVRSLREKIDEPMAHAQTFPIGPQNWNTSLGD